jgi:hypothetical protein
MNSRVMDEANITSAVVGNPSVLFRAGVSKMFMARGHTRYCELVRGPHVEK